MAIQDIKSMHVHSFDDVSSEVVVNKKTGIIIRGGVKVIFDGLEGHGKTLLMTMDLRETIERNIRLFEQGLKPRNIFVNTPLYDDVLEQFGEYAKKHIHRYDDFYSLMYNPLVLEGGCDIYVDEIGAKLDARGWADLSPDFREWLSQCDKVGTRLVGTTQDFSMVDKSFRRLTTHLYRVTKIVGSPRPHPTYPVVKRPWGIFSKIKISARNYQEDNPKIEGGILDYILGIFFLDKKYYGMFDTNAKVVKTGGAPLQHLERKCLVCGKIETKHK